MSVKSRAKHVKKPSPCSSYNRFPQPILFGIRGKGPSGGECIPPTKGAFGARVRKSA